MSFASGRKDDLLWKISKCAKSTHENHCRNLTRLIYNEGAALDIEMNYVSITCRKKRPRIHDVKVHWPVLSMHSWCQYIFTHHPGILLGGHRRSNKAGWEMMLQTFGTASGTSNQTTACFRRQNHWHDAFLLWPTGMKVSHTVGCHLWYKAGSQLFRF